MKALIVGLALLVAVAVYAQHQVTITGAQTGTPDQTIVYRDGSPMVTITPGPVPTITAVDTNVQAGETHTYAMANVVSGVTGPLSAVVSVLIPGAVTPPPPPPNSYVIRVPSPLSFASTVGGKAPATQIMRVSDTSPIDPKYSVVSDSTWLKSTAPTQGASDGLGFQAVVTVTPGALTAGSYVGHLTITMADQTVGGTTYHWTNSPLPVAVTLVITGVTPPPPAMTISCPAASAGVSNQPVGAYSMSVTSGKVTANCTGTK